MNTSGKKIYVGVVGFLISMVVPMHSGAAGGRAHTKVARKVAPAKEDRQTNIPKACAQGGCDVAASQHFIDNVLYVDKTGFGQLSEQERSFIEGSYTKKTSTYGEILYDSAQTLIDDPEIGFARAKKFVDAGCGVGKFAVQVCLNTSIPKVVGVELSPTRYERAKDVPALLKKHGKLSDDRTFDLVHGDIVTVDFSGADIVFMCSTCYSPELLDKMVKKLATLEKGLRVITLKELPNAAKYGFTQIKKLHLPMSWSREKGSDIFVYVLG